jgi:hypothetical protein
MLIVKDAPKDCVQASTDGEKFVWPTGKPHVSFSELSNWLECSYRHKLLFIDGLGSFVQTPHLAFGTGVHNSNEKYIKTRVMDKSIALDFIKKAWKTNEELFTKGPFPSWAPKGFGSVEDWLAKADRVLDDVPPFLEKEFPGWVCYSSEEQLNESIDGQTLKLKGFIDAVISYDGPRKKKKYQIIDWKTCGWGWDKEKQRDFKTQLQLILYKVFWAKKHDIPMKDIACAFALIKRDAKPGKSLGLVKVSVGAKTSARGLRVIENYERSVRNGLFLKNRDSCKFCEFANTVHCPTDL